MSQLGRLSVRIAVIGACLAGGLAVSAAPAGAGGGCHRAVTDAKGVSVRIQEFCFAPSNLWIQPGQSVTWTNRDPVGHVVAGTGGWGTFDPLGEGKSVTVRFDSAGIYPYTCFLHPGMSGSVIVGSVKAPLRTVTTEGTPEEVGATLPATTPPSSPASLATAPPREDGGGWMLAFLVVAALLVVTASGWIADRAVRRRRTEA
jgi:plastocyanin